MVYVWWPDVLYYPDMSSFRDLKNASGRDSKIVQDFASSDICVSLGLKQTSYYILTSFGKGMSLTFHLLAWALTVERTVDRPLRVARCTIIILRSDEHFEHLVRYFTISNLATLSTLLPPLVAFFTTAHDICMWKNCPLFHKLKSSHPTIVAQMLL